MGLEVLWTIMPRFLWEGLGCPSPLLSARAVAEQLDVEELAAAGLPMATGLVDDIGRSSVSAVFSLFAVGGFVTPDDL